jgi:hypothetical protein
MAEFLTIRLGEPAAASEDYVDQRGEHTALREH